MSLTLIGHDDRYAIEQLQMSLFPLWAQPEVVSSLHRGKIWLTAVTTITWSGDTARAVKRLKAADETVRLRRQILQQSFYLAAAQLGQISHWGALAGVRPTKITTKHLLEGGTRESANDLLRSVYYVSYNRSQLSLDCSEASVRAVEEMDENDISLYVGIPFCPTRCTYCSFVSRTIGKRTELLEPYLDALYKEIQHTSKLLETSGKHLRTIYIGGGTPTTLSASQLDRLLGTINDSFDLSRCIEFTVEAGRPDTLDEEKLRTIAAHNNAHRVNRISINPQSMVDSVLRACGRPHTAEDVKRVFRQAERIGCGTINMDLIAGLPTDTLDGFITSLNTVVSMWPSNITVHTLALKKGADLFEKQDNLPSQFEVEKMLNFAEDKLRAMGYKPYYLYRQKYMSGSFENVGWSKYGMDCLYNIYMMEELHSIVSLGGGGMNKVNLPSGRLQRFHNPKFPEQYIEQIESVLQQKEELFALMKGSF